MVSTRQSTGNSVPRKLFTLVSEPTTTKTKTNTKTTTTKKSNSARPKANVSKPRAKATTTGRVEKKKAPATQAKTAAVEDKVKGATVKAVGIVREKPGKKVCPFALVPSPPGGWSKNCERGDWKDKNEKGIERLLFEFTEEFPVDMWYHRKGIFQ